MIKYIKIIFIYFASGLPIYGCLTSCDPNSQLDYYVKNNSSDTLYVERPCCAENPIKALRIDNRFFIKVSPYSTQMYYHAEKTGWPGEKELYNLDFPDEYIIVKGKDTSTFKFSIKDKCVIDIDGQIGNYTRIVN